MSHRRSQVSNNRRQRVQGGEKKRTPSRRDTWIIITNQSFRFNGVCVGGWVGGARTSASANPQHKSVLLTVQLCLSTGQQHVLVYLRLVKVFFFFCCHYHLTRRTFSRTFSMLPLQCLSPILLSNVLAFTSIDDAYCMTHVGVLKPTVYTRYSALSPPLAIAFVFFFTCQRMDVTFLEFAEKRKWQLSRCVAVYTWPKSSNTCRDNVLLDKLQPFPRLWKTTSWTLNIDLVAKNASIVNSTSTCLYTHPLSLFYILHTQVYCCTYRPATTTTQLL